MNQEPRLCSCGCGGILTNPKARFLPYHHLKTKEIQDKKRKTFLDHFGVDNPSKVKEIKEKKQKTCFEHFGKLHPGQVELVKDKIKESFKSKYGVENAQQVQEFKEKSKQTCLERYGVDHAFKSKQFQEKQKQTLLSRYGKDNPSKIKEFQDKKKQTFLEHYGVDCNLKSDDTKTKIKQTCIDRYGVDHPMKNEDIKVRTLHSSRENAWNDLIKQTRWIPLFEKDEFLKHGWKSYIDNKDIFYQFKCSKCGNIQSLTGKDLPLCNVCYPNLNRSKMEVEIAEFVKQYCDDVIESDRTIIAPKELDIYIPSKQLAIEFDGSYWHTNQQLKDSNYHLNKTIQCEEKGIHLLHIFEDEWLFKKDVVKSIIKSNIGIYDKVIQSNQCSVTECNIDESITSFFDNNSLIGYVDSNVCISLIENGIIVFSVLFKLISDDMWKITNFCNKLGYCVEDSFELVTDYFCNNHEYSSIVVQLDRRWYQKKDSIGKFKLDFCFDPFKWKIINGRREWIFEDITNYENCIYDCGICNYLLKGY